MARRGERRADRQRQRILSAAAQVFGRKGFDRATTREIAEEAGISEGTIYNYFAGKDDLLMSIVRKVAPQLFTGDLAGIGEGDDSRAMLTAGLCHLMRTVQENREMAKVVAGEVWRNDEILQEWVIVGGERLLGKAEERLRMAIDEGLLRPIDPRVGARLVLSVGIGLVLPILMGALELDSEQERQHLAEEMSDLLIHGIGERGEERNKGAH